MSVSIDYFNECGKGRNVGETIKRMIWMLIVVIYEDNLVLLANLETPRTQKEYAPL